MSPLSKFEMALRGLLALDMQELVDAGAISDRDYRVTDVPLRGFWSYYAELLGIEPDGAVR